MISGNQNYLEERKMKNNFDYKIAHLEEILTNDKYKQALKNLKYEEKQILYYLAVEEYSVKELSKKLNLSKRKIRKIKKNAIEHFKTNLDKIRQNPKSKNLKSISKNNCLNESRSKKQYLKKSYSKKQSLKKSHCEKQISSKKRW